MDRDLPVLVLTVLLLSGVDSATLMGPHYRHECFQSAERGISTMHHWVCMCGGGDQQKESSEHLCPVTFSM